MNKPCWEECQDTELAPLVALQTYAGLESTAEVQLPRSPPAQAQAKAQAPSAGLESSSGMSVDKRLFFTGKSFVLADLETGRVDVGEMLAMLKNDAKKNPIEHNPKTMMIIVNLHGAILVNDTVPIQRSFYASPDSAEASGHKLIPEKEIDPARLKKGAIRAQIPDGMKVYEVRATTKNVTFHWNYDLDTTAKTFIILKRRAIEEGIPLQTADLLAYCIKMSAVTRESHERYKATGVPMAELDAMPCSIHSNTSSRYQDVYESLFYADATSKDVGKSVGFFPLDPEMDPAVLCRTSSLRSNEAVITSTTDLLEIAAENGATEVIIFNGACAVKRSLETVTEMLDQVQHALDDPVAANIAAIGAPNPTFGPILRKFAVNHPLPDKPPSIPGGKRNKQTKRNKRNKRSQRKQKLTKITKRLRTRRR